MQAPQNAPPPNIGMLVLLALCFWGAMRDRAYKKAGGIRPDRFEKRFLVATILGAILILFVIGLRSAGAAGTLTAVLAVTIFGVWEIHRLRIRKKSPAGGIPK
jgi:hypothetical protein